MSSFISALSRLEISLSCHTLKHTIQPLSRLLTPPPPAPVTKSFLHGLVIKSKFLHFTFVRYKDRISFLLINSVTYRGNMTKLKMFNMLA